MNKEKNNNILKTEELRDIQYRCPLSSKDKIPGIEVNIFVYNPKTKSNDANRWEIMSTVKSLYYKYT